MNNISVVILTKNEERNILDCIEGILEFGEIVIVDDYSEDRTIEIVKSFKKKNINVYEHKLDGDFSAQRNFGLGKAKKDWVLFVDADERVSGKFLNEVKQVVAKNEADAFLIKRKDVVWGKELRYGETGNTKIVRLAKANMGIWHGKVHETWKIKGRVGELINPLMHYPHPTVADFLKEINIYSTIRARELKKEGQKATLVSVVVYPKAKFFLNYIIKLGFLDGVPGLIVALMMSFHSFLARAKLWQLNH